MAITHERLKQLLDYNKSTGEFRWRDDRNHIAAGSVAGNTNKVLGYIQVRVDGRLYYGHRLAWFYVHGEWPPSTVDHINGFRADNRIENLRLATHGQNNISRRKRADNTSGYRGVSWNTSSNKWMAMIAAGGVQTYLGVFDSIDDARDAYRSAARAEFGEFYYDDDQ